jgi:predicted DNA-binding transcriptional regulator YafY
MRASRLLSILIILQLRGRVSAEALAQEFEVSARTIYRDIDELSAAGVPVYAERGRSGGFELADGYRTRLTGLGAEEAEALLLAGAASAASDLGLGAALGAAQLKLLASLPDEKSQSARRVAERFHLDPTPWYLRAEPQPLLPAIAEAVWREKKIRIDYESWKAPVSRELSPLGLVLKGGVWYLVAAGSGKARIYRVSNISNFELRDAPALRPRNFDIAAFWRESSRDFELRLLNSRATIKVSPRGRKILADALPAAFETLERAGRPTTPKGWIQAEIPVEAGEITARKFLRLGGDGEILAPPSLRAEIKQLAADIFELYDAKASGKQRS